MQPQRKRVLTERLVAWRRPETCLLYTSIEHQKDVVTRRTKYELNKAEARAHILEGLKIALDNIDAVIETVSYTHLDVYKRQLKRLYMFLLKNLQMSL